jgi:hypothetical protein
MTKPGIDGLANGDETELLEVAEGKGESKLAVNKTTWAQVGLVTEPGRYMFKFGWLTIIAEDLAVWKQFPDAMFALVKTAAATATDEAEEFHLGAFELGETSPGETSQRRESHDAAPNPPGGFRR